jgi:hypothetical protein
MYSHIMIQAFSISFHSMHKREAIVVPVGICSCHSERLGLGLENTSGWGTRGPEFQTSTFLRIPVVQGSKILPHPETVLQRRAGRI